MLRVLLPLLLLAGPSAAYEFEHRVPPCDEPANVAEILMVLRQDGLSQTDAMLRAGTMTQLRRTDIERLARLAFAPSRDPGSTPELQEWAWISFGEVIYAACLESLN